MSTDVIQWLDFMGKDDIFESSTSIKGLLKGYGTPIRGIRF